MEEFFRDGHYTVRAELPGGDPEHEVEVSVASRPVSAPGQRGTKDSALVNQWPCTASTGEDKSRNRLHMIAARERHQEVESRCRSS
jgi:hypothetical protein